MLPAKESLIHETSDLLKYDSVARDLLTIQGITTNILKDRKIFE